jgi:DNA-binding response OmpR family regulator
MKALIVDDDLALADVVSFTMRRAGYEVINAYDGQSALELWETEEPDLIILDLNLPKLDGLSVCRRVRKNSEIPIIILSVRGEEDDVVQGLSLGADDYIVKPFSPRQLVARAEAVLRRAKTPATSQGPLTVSGLTLDPARSIVTIGDGKEIHLTKLENTLLETFMLNHGQVMPYESLIDVPAAQED